MSDEAINEGFSKKEDNFSCDVCGFTNQSKMGMKRHISIQHKEAHTKKRGRADTESNDDDSSSLDEKKTKTSGGSEEPDQESESYAVQVQ